MAVKRRRTQVTVTIDPEKEKTLRAVGDRLMSNFSEMIDRAVEFYLTNQAKADLEEVKRTKAALRAIHDER